MTDISIVEDTYAEGFRSLYAEVLITAHNKTWLDHAVDACTGHASSTIMCDCEAGLDHYVDPSDTPDGRVGAVCQFHVPRFNKNRVRALELVLIARIGQNVLTCPTTACFDNLGQAIPKKEAEDGGKPYELGRKIGFFCDNYEFAEKRHGRDCHVLPIMGGEFVMESLYGRADGVMGGNIWFFGDSIDSALEATQRGVDAANDVPGIIMPFPGGIAGSGSKAGSVHQFLFASTNHPFCPTLREQLGEESCVPEGVVSIQEIIINGRDLETVTVATHAAIDAALGTPGLKKISAGNYNGRLGKTFIYLRKGRQPE